MVAEIGVRPPQAQEYRQPPKSWKRQGVDRSKCWQTKVPQSPFPLSLLLSCRIHPQPWHPQFYWESFFAQVPCRHVYLFSRHLYRGVLMSTLIQHVHNWTFNLQSIHPSKLLLLPYFLQNNKPILYLHIQQHFLINSSYFSYLSGWRVLANVTLFSMLLSIVPSQWIFF